MYHYKYIRREGTDEYEKEVLELWEAKFDAQGSDDEEDAPLAPEVEAALERVRASDEKRLYVELFSPYDDDAGRQASSQQRTGDGDDDDTLTYGKTRCRS